MKRKVVAGVALDALDVTIFSSLWIHNVSGVDFTLGAPATQVYPTRHPLMERSGGNMNVEVAEAVLNEIAGVFQPGEGSKMLAGDSSEWDFLPLPLQACEVVWEEVWEYEEGDKR